MSRLLNPDNLTVLGWSLLNSLWQMGLLWLGYLLLTGNHKRFSSAMRHNLGLLFSGFGSAWSLYCFVTSLASGKRSGVWPVPGFFSFRVAAGVNVLLSALTLLYLMILVGWTCHYLLAYYRMRVTKKRAGEYCPDPLQLFSERMIPALGIRRQVRIRMVSWTDTAQTVGFVKPLILLPVALINRLSLEQVETILLHELLHIRRHDYLTNIGMTIFRILFFFNPFAHFFFKTVAREREHACDDGVLRWNYPAPVYAEALFALEKFRQDSPTLSLAAHGNNPHLLLQRVRRVVGQPIPGKKPFSPALCCCLAAAISVFALQSSSRFSRPVITTLAGKGIRVQTSISTGIVPEKTIKAAGLYKSKDQITKVIKPAGNRVEPSLPIQKKTVPSGLRMSASGRSSDETGELEDVMLRAAPPPDQLQYADHTEPRNYSNEQDESPEQPASVNFNGSPYVPSASFLYAPSNDSSTVYLLLQHKINTLAMMDKAKLAEITASINAQINLQTMSLRQMEKKNRKLLQGQQKSIQPQIQILLNDIQRKKMEIDQLYKLLRQPDREIINI